MKTFPIGNWFIILYVHLNYGSLNSLLRAILNKSWWQHPTKHQLYGHLPPITKPIQVRQTRHAGLCWRCRDELIRDLLLWTPIYGRAKAGRPARTYIQQLCEEVALKNSQRRWTIGRSGVRGLGISVLAARHDYDDDDVFPDVDGLKETHFCPNLQISDDPVD